jgi:hypothetical protein
MHTIIDYNARNDFLQKMAEKLTAIFIVKKKFISRNGFLGQKTHICLRQIRVEMGSKNTLKTLLIGGGNSISIMLPFLPS